MSEREMIGHDGWECDEGCDACEFAAEATRLREALAAALKESGEAAERAEKEAMAVLDECDAPTESGGVMLSLGGRIRALRSKLIIDGNRWAGEFAAENARQRAALERIAHEGRQSIEAKIARAALDSLALVGSSARPETIEEAVAAEQALAETLGEYAGQWVAVAGHKVVEHAPTLAGLRERLELWGSRLADVDGCFLVGSGSPFFFASARRETGEEASE